jgi:ribose 5-phosphate isomerase A
LSAEPEHTDVEAAKRSAAMQAAALVEEGMTVGLGTGSTVGYLLPALASRGLRLRCVATSLATESAARSLGLVVEPFEELARLDIAIDGADQVDPDRWLVKGGGGAHTREKIVATAAERFVVIVSPDKVVSRLAAPVPVELFRFGLASTLARRPELRVRPDTPPSPDGGVIADWIAPLADPLALSALLEADPGVVSHGLFPPSLVSEVIVGQA